MSRHQLGRWGERVAATHLKAHGYEILERNWRCVYGEMDLIARIHTAEGPLLAFVEVKTRRGRASGTPEEALTPRKAQKLVTVAQMYLAAHDLDDIDWQIDLVAIELEPKTGRVVRCDHLPNMVWG